MVGQTVSHYKILEKIGEGGMGVVYKAQDLTLDRLVALKFLPESSSSGSDTSRFIQEARAAAALNHPNICTIHGIEESDGRSFIVMEFVDGQMLEEKKATLTQKQAIEIGIQIAEGLAAAHEKGVVHRDIKPENIMIRKDGIVQIMDFGLAKLRGASRLTKEGSTVGTAGYMSPEQVQGQETDHRSDIFSLGVLLYEMFAGQPPFKGVHETALLYEIVNVDPVPVSASRPEIAPELDRIVLECLQKEPDERYQAAKDISKDLRRFKRESSRLQVSRTISTNQYSSATAMRDAIRVEPSKLSKQLLWPVVSLVLLIAFIVALWSPWRTVGQASTQVMRFVLSLPLATPLVGGASTMAISPDGKNFVYLAATAGIPRLYIRPIDRFTSQPLGGTEGASDPFFSPDGQWIGFFNNGRLKKVSIFGGSPQDVCVVPSFLRGGFWATDNTIFFGLINSSVHRVPAGGGSPVEVTRLDSTLGEISHRFPQMLPDGKTLLFTSKTKDMTTFDDALIVTENIETHERKIIVRGGSFGRYVQTGHIVYARGGSIYGVPFDPVKLQTLGPPLPSEEGGMLNPLSGDANFSISNTGILIYAPLGAFSGLDASLIWIDRQGKASSLIDSTRAYGIGALSPDGQKLAMSIRAANDDIWVYQFNKGTLTRITFGGSNHDAPKWMPDGKHIVYTAERDRRLQLFSKPWDGSGSEEKIAEGVNIDIQSSVSISPDGSFCAFGQQGDIWIVNLKGDRKLERFIASPAPKSSPSFSPDGRWLSYFSTESGQREVYVVSFPKAEGKYQVSSNGAQSAFWTSDSKRLLYVSGLQVMEVQIRPSPTFDFLSPRKVLQLPQTWNGFLDCTSDGTRFAVGVSKNTEANTSQVNIVLGWFDELKKSTRER